MFNNLRDPRTGRRIGGDWKKSIPPLLVSAGLLAFLLTQVDRAKIWATLRQADPSLFIAALTISLAATTMLASDRWRVLLHSLGVPMGLVEVIKVEWGAAPIKFFVPLKIGEVLKVLYVNRVHGEGFERVLGTKLVDKYLVLIGLFGPMGVGAALAGIGWGVALAGGLFVGMLALLLATPLHGLAIRVASLMHKRVGLLAERVLASLAALPTSRKLYLVAHATAFNLLIVVYLGLCLASMGVRPPAADMLFYFPLIQLIALLPVTVSGIGARETAVVYFFAKYGSDAALFNAGLLMTFSNQMLMPLVGLSCVTFLVRALMKKPVAESPDAGAV
ncbi:MAG: flippase-like domain-containing protein [Deltaproteobacteria bacterium]|nr:flippase-like domain-containing protein [Deltaproteobacteria bacterium]MCB9490042.1 flippase-like domain-containing protein [Deltaproteobacteria bacterium]